MFSHSLPKKVFKHTSISKAHHTFPIVFIFELFSCFLPLLYVCMCVCVFACVFVSVRTYISEMTHTLPPPFLLSFKKSLSFLLGKNSSPGWEVAS